MRETEGQIKVFALYLGTVTDSDQLQLTLETLADTFRHVGNQCARRAGHPDMERLQRDHDPGHGRGLRPGRDGGRRVRHRPHR